MTTVAILGIGAGFPASGSGDAASVPLVPLASSFPRREKKKKTAKI